MSEEKPHENMCDAYSNNIQEHEYIIPITKAYTVKQFCLPIGHCEILNKHIPFTPKELIIKDIKFLHNKGIDCALLTYKPKEVLLIFLARVETHNDEFIIDDYYPISSLVYAQLCKENKYKTKILHEFLAVEDISILLSNT